MKRLVILLALLGQCWGQQVLPFGRKSDEANTFYKRAQQVLSARIGKDQQLRPLVEFFNKKFVPAFFWQQKVYGTDGAQLEIAKDRFQIIVINPHDANSLHPNARIYAEKLGSKSTFMERSILWVNHPFTDDWLAAMLAMHITFLQQALDSGSPLIGSQLNLTARNGGFNAARGILDAATKDAFSAELRKILKRKPQDEEFHVLRIEEEVRLNALFGAPLSQQEKVYRKGLLLMLLNLEARPNTEEQLGLLKDYQRIIVDVPTSAPVIRQ